MNKRGLSAIVATVLIILITILGLILFWMGILPLLQQDFAKNLDMRVIILINEGYTVYDKDTHFAFVHLDRKPDKVNLKGLEIIFNINGESVTYLTREVPASNGKIVYAFNFTRDGIVGIPTKVAVAPVIIKGARKVVGSILDTVDMPMRSATITALDDDTSREVIINPPKGTEPCFDWDRDGYGDPGSTGCSGGPQLDCNDRKPLINPGMTERCENCVEDNCNGLTDYSDPQCSANAWNSYLVSNWEFEGNGVDTQGNNDATVYGGSNVSYKTSLACQGQSIDFGIGGYAIVDSSSDDCNLNMNDDEGTISVWFKRNAYQTRYTHVNYIFSMFDWIDGANMNSRLYLYFNSSNDEVGTAMGKNPGWERNITSVPLGGWHFATVTWKASSPGATSGDYTIYMDGRKVNTFLYTGYDGVAQRLTWGTWRDNLVCNNHAPSNDEFRESFNGQLDEGRVYNKSFDANEVKVLYNWYIS